MSDDPNAAGAQPGAGTEATDGSQAEPAIHCHTQYVKDLSFENPHAIRTATGEDGAPPDVQINVEINVAAVQQNTFEVGLSIEGQAKRGDSTMFLVSLEYAGLFTCQNVPPEVVEGVLYVHCPTLLFPFARQVIAEVTRNGGYPPLLINAVDFNAIYQSHKANAAANGAGEGAAPQGTA